MNPYGIHICILVCLCCTAQLFGQQPAASVTEDAAVEEWTLEKCIGYSLEHNSRLRKYYRLTPAGQERIRTFLVEWQDVMRAYRYIASQGAGDISQTGRKDETP